ncbi:MAG: CpsD/CapB family tyrosine-protein kinase [Eubacteriales bacterium]
MAITKGETSNIEEISLNESVVLLDNNITKNKKSSNKFQQVNLEIDKEEDFHTKEAYKTLRENLVFMGSDVKVISVTSCTPNEGKSSVAMNLALSIAEAGKRVILVDADLRKSVLVSRYKTKKVKYGLTHLLSKQCDLKEVICTTNIKGLHTIFAGPVAPNPSELLGGPYFKYLIETCREHYDYVIIDTPPLGSVIDSAVVSKECNGVVLVISQGEISYKFAEKVKNQLEKAEARILGTVLNKVDMGTKGVYGKYYAKYYGQDYQ